MSLQSAGRSVARLQSRLQSLGGTGERCLYSTSSHVLWVERERWQEAGGWRSAIGHGVAQIARVSGWTDWRTS
jgi:hypothetical protein